MIDKAREIALKTLYNIDINNAYSNIELDKQINNNLKNINSKDIAFISELVYGVITWKLTLDEIVKKHSKIKLKKISPWIINILRLGIYQIVFLNKVPKSAAVNESVNLAKKYGHKSSSGFVNAILRKVSVADYEELFQIKGDIERISKTTSMPEWIVEKLLEQHSLEETNDICKNSNIRPKISIRVNKLKISKEKLKEKLKDVQNIEVQDGILNDFLILPKAKGLEKMQDFKNGEFTVQDEAAGLTALILNPEKEEKVLDACSSPGGKTTYIAELMENTGLIEAWDIHKHRVKLVEDTYKRLGITNIKTKVQDATIEMKEYFEKFDKILLDVPCLGLGVLKRKPDIKWQKTKEDIIEITKTQEKILETCSKYLKKGGKLVYSTCSILNEENIDVITKFLKNHSDFKIEKIQIKPTYLQKVIKKENNKNYFEKFIENSQYLQVYQNENTDGFFICKLSKS